MRTLLLGLACCALLATACRDAAPGASKPGAQAVSAAPMLAAISQPAALAASATPTPEPEVAVAKAAATPVPPNPPAIAAAPPRTEVHQLPPFTTARQALVLDEASAGILYAKDAHARVPPASITKIATAIVAIEHGDLDRTVTVDVDARDFYDSTLMGLRRGDRFTVRDLLYGMMLASGNDAAVAVGRAVSGNDAKFVEEMNALVARLGLQNTHFMNPHGLDETGHYTSAYDIAMIARYGMSMPEFREIAHAEAYTAKGSRTISMGSLISGLLRWVPGADGVKSGFTYDAGRTLVLSVDRGRRVYAVVMNDPNREMDGASLIEWAFANHAWNASPAVDPRNGTATVAQPPTPTPDDGAGVVRAARDGN